MVDRRAGNDRNLPLSAAEGLRFGKKKSPGTNPEGFY
jgi:hypothetical protein